MSVLTFAKPKRAQSVEAWKSISADGAPPGVYTPNMSEKDQERWRAKLVGTKSGELRIEIRSSKSGSQMVIIVAGAKQVELSRNQYRRTTLDPYEIKMSANGPLWFKVEVWKELKAAVQEARDILSTLDHKNVSKLQKDNTLAAIKAGTWPLSAP